MKRQGRATVRPIRTEQSEAAERLGRINAGIKAELSQLHKTNALLIATQFAANHEVEFDVGYALAAIIERFEQHIATLNLLALEARADE